MAHAPYSVLDKAKAYSLLYRNLARHSHQKWAWYDLIFHIFMTSVRASLIVIAYQHRDRDTHRIVHWITTMTFNEIFSVSFLYFICFLYFSFENCANINNNVSMLGWIGAIPWKWEISFRQHNSRRSAAFVFKCIRGRSSIPNVPAHVYTSSVG